MADSSAAETGALEALPLPIRTQVVGAGERVASIVRERFLVTAAGRLPKSVITVGVIEDVACECGLPSNWRDICNNRGIEMTGELDNWPDVVDEVSGRLKRKTIEAFPDHFRNVVRFKTLISSNLAEQVCERWPRNLRDGLDMIFSIVYLAHLVGHEVSGVSRMIQTTLEAGSMPLGWLGHCPEGRLIVYWPYDVPPTFEE